MTSEWFFDIIHQVNNILHGGVAQLGERLNGIQEVNGSIPSVSTRTEERVFVSLLFLFCFPFSKGIEPSVHLVRFASAEHEGHIIGDLRSKCEGLAPSIPSVSTKTEKRVLLLCFFILFSFFKRDRTISPSRAVRPILRGSVRFSPKYADLGILY